MVLCSCCLNRNVIKSPTSDVTSVGSGFCTASPKVLAHSLLLGGECDFWGGHLIRPLRFLASYLADCPPCCRWRKSPNCSSSEFCCTCCLIYGWSLALFFWHRGFCLVLTRKLFYRVSFKFGIITCFAGIVGVGLGSYGSQKLRSRSVKADPLICALGMLLTAPFLYFSLLVSRSYPDLTLVYYFATYLRLTRLLLMYCRRSCFSRRSSYVWIGQ